jgi:hypothetical protein
MKRILALIAFTMLLAPAGAWGGVLITFDAPGLTGNPGDILAFVGNITNLDPTDPVYLNGVDVNLAGDDFTVDTLDDFFANVPISLNGGQSTGMIELFTVTIGQPLIDPLDTFVGVYTMLGGVDGSDQTIIGSAQFSVTTTPEPDSLAMMGCGVLAYIVFACFRLLYRAREENQWATVWLRRQSPPRSSTGRG